ncbi:hypothetical protein NDN08_004670 [Rhodosorus marinus]|uniref:DUF1995 domain-containing protein n=1 Tax=Rhodosorus marinus TaxID=101924 RepID=A0AAV8USI1_9RHOD|nr:hypothetical protein NDN08_004670 [Rhodosorus marinus]
MATCSFISGVLKSPSGIQRRSAICMSEDRPSAPGSLEEVLVGAVNSVTGGIEGGLKRLRVTVLLPGLNDKVENTFPFNEELLFFVTRALATSEAFDRRHLRLLFESTGQAASARAYYEKTGNPTNENVSYGSLLPKEVREGGGDGDAYILVSPQNRTGDPVILDVEKILNKAPDAIHILLNPKLEHNQANIAASIVETDRRRVLIESFKEVYHYRPLYVVRRPTLETSQVGLLQYQYGRPWRVFTGSEQDLTFADEFESLPGRSQISKVVEAGREKNRKPQSEEEVQAIKQSEQKFLGLLANLSIATILTAVFLFLRTREVVAP